MVSNSNYNVQLLIYQIMFCASLISLIKFIFVMGYVSYNSAFYHYRMFTVIFSFIKYRWSQKLMHLMLLFFFVEWGTQMLTRKRKILRQNKNKKSDSYLLFTILCVN